MQRALAESIAPLPATIREPALGSLAQALTIADRLGPVGRDLSGDAKEAFMQAMHSSLLMLGIVVLVSATVVAIWAPGRDGRQLRIVRRIVAGRAERP